jgi:VanZ family protein
MQTMQRLLGDKIALCLALLGQIIATLAMLWPNPELPDVDLPFLDKWAHFVIFSILYLLWAWALESKGPRVKWTLHLVFALLIYGIIIESIQHYWYVSRKGDLMDVLANATGILIGFLAHQLKSKVYP